MPVIDPGLGPGGSGPGSLLVGLAMSFEHYCSRIRDSSLSPADQQWFPAWICRYAEATKTMHGPLPVTREGVIDFLRMLHARVAAATSDESH